MNNSASIEKLGEERDAVQDALSTHEGTQKSKIVTWSYLKHYFTSREGWIGDYVILPSPIPPPPLTHSGLCLLDNPKYLAT
jgi:hypothetical protein